MGYYATSACPSSSACNHETPYPRLAGYEAGFRFLTTHTGRWVSRDPIGEEGGENTYVFCANSGISAYDLLGLAAPGANCCGYALTGDFPVNIQVPSGKAVYTWLKEMGWRASRIQSADECQCECSEFKAIMVVYKMTDKYSKKEKKYQKTKQPDDDIFSHGIDWSEQTDYHFMRSEFGCGKDYKCVEHFYSMKDIKDAKRRGKPIKPEDVDPNDYVPGNASLCLCKARPAKETKTAECACSLPDPPKTPAQ